jgi:hypothetical protein
MGNSEMSVEERKNVYKFVDLRNLTKILETHPNNTLKGYYPVCINFYVDGKEDAIMISGNRDVWRVPWASGYYTYDVDFYAIKIINNLKFNNNEFIPRVGLTQEQYDFFHK